MRTKKILYTGEAAIPRCYLELICDEPEHERRFPHASVAEKHNLHFAGPCLTSRHSSQLALLFPSSSTLSNTYL